MNKKRKKIVMIGPVYPFKGGIAHYTALMYRALAEKYDLTMVSYKMQYPKILFRKEQKDYSSRTFEIENTKYLIHTANPFNWIDTASKIRKMNPDLIIMQWWHPYFAPCYWMLAKLMNKAQILFICHNVFPHERFLLDRRLTKFALKTGNKYIVQSTVDEQDLTNIIPNAVYKKTVHPTYNVFKMTNITQKEAKTKLSLLEKDKVLLFFGLVRKYKGLEYLIKAMPALLEKDNTIKLLIAGDFGKDRAYYEKLIADIGVRSNIIVYNGYIPDAEVENYFIASDLVVCPYLSATQSGIVQIAYGFERPVIVTNVGGLPDVVINEKTGYIVEAKSSKAIAEAIIKYYYGMESEMLINIKSEAKRYSWDRMVEAITNLIL